MNKIPTFLQKSVRTSDETFLMYAIMIVLEVVEGSRSENTGGKFSPPGLEYAGESLRQTTVMVKELSLVT